eukprot:COSAG01_NODE_33068_length_570_cov_2.070064_2_plen_35_part_01
MLLDGDTQAHCGKMRATRMLLEEFKAVGSKVLLFS